MWAFVTDVQGERFVDVCGDKAERKICGDIVDPTASCRRNSVYEKCLVAVISLADEAGCECKSGTGRLASHVPLADHSGDVTGLLQLARVSNGVYWKRGAVVDHAVQVVVTAGQNRSATGRTE